MAQQGVTIGYWNCRGYLNCIKLMLEYKKVPYNVVSVPRGPPPHYSKDEWMANKEQLLDGFDFPNLPYYTDGEVKITHCSAILQHLGRKYQLYPESEGEMIAADMIREEIVDLRGAECAYLYFPKHRIAGTEPTFAEKQEARKAYRTNVLRHLNKLNKVLAKYPGPWLLGERLTYIDFFLYEYADHVRILEGDLFQDYPNLVAFMTKFEALPNLGDFLKIFNRLPLFSVGAFFGKEVGDIPPL